MIGLELAARRADSAVQSGVEMSLTWWECVGSVTNPTLGLVMLRVDADVR